MNGKSISKTSKLSLARLWGHKLVTLTDVDSESKGIHWWEELTGFGGEEMVVKPLDFIDKTPKELV